MGDAAALGHSSNTSIKTSQKPEPAVKQTLGAHEQAVVDPRVRCAVLGGA
jgi:hypothetical protein